MSSPAGSFYDEDVTCLHGARLGGVWGGQMSMSLSLELGQILGTALTNRLWQY